jgi:cyclopropane fatty-acyl-phospholipid synthase-like methyltransferase
MPYVTWLRPGEGTEFPIRLKTRLRAWWEGYDLSVLKPLEGNEVAAAQELKAAAAVTPPSAPEQLDQFGRPLWSASRIKVAETLWGGDFTSPGGIEHTAMLVKPFGITSAMSILDMAAGLGGVARTIARDYKAWVTGMEASPMLASLAQERSVKGGFAKSAPVEHYDPEHIQLTRRYDGIFAKEAFFTVHNKEQLFDSITKALKPGGQLVFTDYCIEHADISSAALQDWVKKEPVPPTLWSVEQVIKALRARKIDVRTHEDMTVTQKQLILRSLGHFLQHLNAHTLDLETKKAVLDEVELWARRVKTFDAGLRVYRFYGMKH